LKVQGFAGEVEEGGHGPLAVNLPTLAFWFRICTPIVGQSSRSHFRGRLLVA